MFAENKKLAFTNCNIVSVHDGSVLHNSTIVVEDGMIIEVSQINVSHLHEVVAMDMSGLWVMPGIIDLHVHFCEEPDPKLATGFLLEETPLFTGFRALRNLRESINYGITTVRDAGAYDARNLAVREAVENGIICGPEIKACGFLITYPEGHSHKHGIQIRGVAQARDAVRKNAELGVDFIKVTNDPQDNEAKNRPIDPTFTTDEFSSLVDEAHSRGLKVACHTFPSESGLNNALDAGVDTLEHAVPLNDKILERFLSQDVIIVPTFVAAYDEFSIKYVTQRVELDLVRTHRYDSTNYPKGSLSFLRPQGVPESIVIWFDYLVEYLPKAIMNGVQIGIGTDAGCAGTNFRSAIREMFFLTQFGSTNLQVLQYATLIGAKAIGEDNWLGQIAPGYKANFIFLKQNPIVNLDTLLEVQAVVVNGKSINKV